MNDSQVDQSLVTFFSSPNIVWPGMAADHPVAERISGFLHASGTRGECPLVLPRRDSPDQVSIVYVVCWDRSHAGRMRPLLHAAVADYLSPFDGRVASLRTTDSAETSILSMVGPGTTYVLRPTAATEGRLIVALERLVRSLHGQPRRSPTLARPVGRMLRELDLALATGSTAQSASILQEIERAGGISHENVAFLQIQRLGRLGQDHELLSHGSLPTIVHTEPPLIVREAILSAWGRINLHMGGVFDLDLAFRRLVDEPIDVAMLVDERLTTTGDPYVLSVVALVALARDDADLAQALHPNPGLPAELRARIAEKLLAEPTGGETNVEGVPSSPVIADLVWELTAGAEESLLPGSWLEWIDRLAGGDVVARATTLAEAWEPPWRLDAEIGEAIDDLPDLATDALLSGVAAFLDTAEPNHPAPQTARALLRRYLIEERFGPADLAAMASLVTIYLSSAPSHDDYTSLLDDIATFAPQWSSVSTATQALDLADAVACGPRVAPEAQARFISAVLGPLNAQSRRLGGGLRSLASLVTSDLGLDWVWASADVGNASRSAELPAGLSVLIYSLDEGTVARVASSLGDLYPTLTIHQSSDLVGTPALRQHSRRADLIAIATGRAAHAATGFITSHAGGRICYPDGCGAASMLRAIEGGLDELRSASSA